jgi:SAM-dependent methyltransferase
MDPPSAESNRSSTRAVVKNSRRHRLDRLQRLLEAIERLETDPDFPMPPQNEVVRVGLSDFRETGIASLERFVTFGALDPDADVLDVGCGSGRMAIPLTCYLREGSYIGLDVSEAAIKWCKREVEPRHPSFRFEHIDLFNDYYNPASANDAAGFRFPFEDEQFDFVIATSLFTHMFRDEVANYLGEFSRVLRLGGAAFVTAFLVNADSITAMLSGSPKRFLHVHRDALIANPKRPAGGVALHEAWLVADARRVGLGVDRIAYGAWTGQGRLTGQDVLLLRRDH